MAVTESLVDLWRGDSFKTKPPFKGSHARSGGDKGYKSYNYAKEGSSEVERAKRVRVETSARSSSQRLVVSYAMIHIGHVNVLRGRPSML